MNGAKYDGHATHCPAGLGGVDNGRVCLSPCVVLTLTRPGFAIATTPPRTHTRTQTQRDTRHRHRHTHTHTNTHTHTHTDTHTHTHTHSAINKNCKPRSFSTASVCPPASQPPNCSDLPIVCSFRCSVDGSVTKVDVIVKVVVTAAMMLARDELRAHIAYGELPEATQAAVRC